MCHAKSRLATIVENRETLPGSNIHFLQLSLEPLPADDIFHAGQFVVMPPLNNASWGRPYSISQIGQERIGIYVKVAGSNSAHYSRLKIGEKIEVIGSSGTAFELPDADEIIFVAGGTGIAPLLPMAEKVIRAGKKARFLVGVKNELQIFGLEELAKLGIEPEIILEEKPLKNDCRFIHPSQGLVTKLLIMAEKNPRMSVVACGPRMMLAEVAKICAVAKIKCQVSVEVLMCCGTGLCCGCAIEGIDGTFKKVCADGPLFDAEWINWAPGKFILLPAIQIVSSRKSADNPFQIILNKQDKRKVIMDYPWTLGAGGDSLEEAESDRDRKVGAYRPKGVTLHPKSGNPTPRICECGDGNMLNSIGMCNEGVDSFIENDLFRWLALGKPVEVQIAGETVEEFPAVAEKFKNLPITSASVNISCPNIENGLAFGTDPIAAGRIIRSVRVILPYVHLNVKLTPNVTDIVAIASAVVEAGADSVSLINTLKGMRIDIKTGRPKLGKGSGGLSGPGIMAVGVADVYQIFRANLGVPIGGMGGISCGEDALEYFFAGATWVEVVSAYFPNRHIFDETTATVGKFLDKNNCRVQDIIGLAHRSK